MNDDTTIDRASIKHAYQQVADAIAARIAAGQYPGRLPSERALAEEFGISYPTTVRHALAILRQRGMIVSVHGRGTFIPRQPQPSNASWNSWPKACPTPRSPAAPGSASRRSAATSPRSWVGSAQSPGSPPAPPPTAEAGSANHQEILHSCITHCAGLDPGTRRTVPTTTRASHQRRIVFRDDVLARQYEGTGGATLMSLPAPHSWLSSRTRIHRARGAASLCWRTSRRCTYRPSARVAPPTVIAITVR